jgi:hypothetical protein
MHAIIRRLKTSPSSLGLCGKQQEVFVVNAVNPQHVLCPSRNFQVPTQGTGEQNMPTLMVHGNWSLTPPVSDCESPQGRKSRVCGELTVRFLNEGAWPERTIEYSPSDPPSHLLRPAREGKAEDSSLPKLSTGAWVPKWKQRAMDVVLALVDAVEQKAGGRQSSGPVADACCQGALKSSAADAAEEEKDQQTRYLQSSQHFSNS